MTFRFLANPIQLFVTALFLSAGYSLDVFAQTKPLDPDSKTSTIANAPALPRQETVNYTTYSVFVSVSGESYSMSGQFTVRDSKGDKLDKSDVTDFQLTANNEIGKFSCKLDSLTSFEIAGGGLSFKCQNKNGLAALNSLDRSSEIRVQYKNSYGSGENKSSYNFGEKSTSFSGSGIDIRIQKLRQVSTSSPSLIIESWSLCDQKDSLLPETKKTVEAMLVVAGTKDCKQANSILLSKSILKLRTSEISDLKPLTSLANLTELDLSGNKISDITPLSELTNLTILDLSQNQIRDINPLARLNNVTTLFLDRNQISDILPLANLTNLTGLLLDRNKISNIKPLSKLTGLKMIALDGNPIKEKVCPLKPESICRF